MKPTLVLAVFALTCSQAFGSYIGLSISESSKIVDGGIKRTDGLLTGQDLSEFGGSKKDLRKTLPVAKLFNQKVNLSVSNYELRHRNDNGREMFELVIRVNGGKDAFEAGLVYSNHLDTAAADQSFPYTNTPEIVIRSSNYNYIKDLATKLRGDASVVISCLIERAEVITLLTGESDSQILKFDQVSCH